MRPNVEAGGTYIYHRVLKLYFLHNSRLLYSTCLKSHGDVCEYSCLAACDAV